MNVNTANPSASSVSHDIDGICSSLAGEGFSLKLRGFSAIDRYLRMPSLPCLWAETNANIAVLARFVENLRFPGVEVADGAADIANGTCYFRCIENGDFSTSLESEVSGMQTSAAFPLLSFALDLQTGRFQDPLGVYPVLKKLTCSPGGAKEPPCPDEAGFGESAVFSGAGRYRIIMDASLLLARYAFADWTKLHMDGFCEALSNCLKEPPPEAETQRAFLSCLLVSPRPDRGFNILQNTGFLEELWPELSGFDHVDHSKEFHPEGNVWNHTMETFRHRKALGSGAFDLRLSLGLLLHDAGKPIAASSGSRRFDGHAELGAMTAVRFLERLEFGQSMMQDVFYLVRNHMLPAALKKLPLAKTREIMSSPLFPTLMELYRCDESSSFKGLDEFYENSAAYQSYLRNLRNPYRSADGKKIGRKELLKR